MGNKIDFYCSNLQSELSEAEILDSKSYDLLEPCCNFIIKINDKIFFDEPDFPIFELWQQILIWKEKDGDFFYNSIETEDNPLISFSESISKNNCFKIASPWQIFECDDVFSKEVLLKILKPYII